MNVPFLKDLAERAVSTYVQAFLGLLIANNVFATSGFDVSAVEGAAVATIPAGLSAIKSLLAAQIGQPGTASLVSQAVTTVVQPTAEAVASQVIEQLTPPAVTVNKLNITGKPLQNNVPTAPVGPVVTTPWAPLNPPAEAPVPVEAAPTPPDATPSDAVVVAAEETPPAA